MVLDNFKRKNIKKKILHRLIALSCGLSISSYAGDEHRTSLHQPSEVSLNEVALSAIKPDPTVDCKTEHFRLSVAEKNGELNMTLFLRDPKTKKYEYYGDLGTAKHGEQPFEGDAKMRILYEIREFEELYKERQEAGGEDDDCDEDDCEEEATPEELQAFKNLIEIRQNIYDNAKKVEFYGVAYDDSSFLISIYYDASNEIVGRFGMHSWMGEFSCLN